MPAISDLKHTFDKSYQWQGSELQWNILIEIMKASPSMVDSINEHQTKQSNEVPK